MSKTKYVVTFENDGEFFVEAVFNSLKAANDFIKNEVCLGEAEDEMDSMVSQDIMECYSVIATECFEQ